MEKKLFVTKDNTFGGKIFPDESKFNTFNSDGRNYVWRGANTVEHSDSVMVWLHGNGTRNLVSIDGILGKYEYLHVLKNNLNDCGHKLGLLEDFNFQRRS